LLAAGDAIVDVPLAAGYDATIWSDATYGKGSLGFLAIRDEIGAAAFDRALHDVATRYAWGEMTPDDLRAAFEGASGKDLDALWSHWFDEAAMTHEEIEEIAAAFGGQD
jgi:aminopeptidase N